MKPQSTLSLYTEIRQRGSQCSVCINFVFFVIKTRKEKYESGI